MDDLSELYQQVILDHNRRPRHFGKLALATRTAEGHNPVCGDHIQVHVRVSDGTITEIAFEGSGCAISRASASLMTEAVWGKAVPAAENLFRAFQALVTADPGADLDRNHIAQVGK